jgi:hypothetical protein
MEKTFKHSSTKDSEIDILESLNFVLSFENWGYRLATRRPGTCLNVILRSAATKNLLVICFAEGQKHKADPSLRSG